MMFVLMSLILLDVAFLIGLVERHRAQQTEEIAEGWRRELDDLLQMDSLRRAQEQSTLESSGA